MQARTLALLLAAAALAGGIQPVLAAPEVSAPQRIEAPFLWRVEGATPSFLFGSIHLPDERVHALPPVFDEALAASDIVLTEIPLDGESMMAAQAAQLIGEGTPLVERLPPEVYGRVAAYLRSKGLPIEAFGRIKLWALWVTLGQIDYLAELMKRPALDMALWREAGALGKERAAIETLEEQLSVFEAFSREEMLQLIEQTIEDLEQAREGVSPMETLVEAYVAGDLDALQALMTENVDMDSVAGRKFVKLLVDERNARMADRIATRLRAEPEKSHLFAVGTLHFPGEKGLLALLAKQGFTLTRLSAGDVALPPSESRPSAVGE